jgi:large subunit ribosomal protein L16
MLFPKKTKYKKQFKCKFTKKKITLVHKIIYGQFALKALEETCLTAKQIEATRRSIVRKMRRLGFLWIRIFPNIPVTSKPIESRMGKGKGSVSFWVAQVKKGQILYEISGISYEIAKQVLISGSKKLPIKTKIILK